MSARQTNEFDHTDPLHRWQQQHEQWAKRQSIPPEQLAWCREQIAQAAGAYQAGLDAGLSAGYRMGLAMGLHNGLAAAEAARGDDRD